MHNQKVIINPIDFNDKMIFGSLTNNHCYSNHVKLLIRRIPSLDQGIGVFQTTHRKCIVDHYELIHTRFSLLCGLSLFLDNETLRAYLDDGQPPCLYGKMCNLLLFGCDVNGEFIIVDNHQNFNDIHVTAWKFLNVPYELFVSDIL